MLAFSVFVGVARGDDEAPEQAKPADDGLTRRARRMVQPVNEEAVAPGFGLTTIVVTGAGVVVLIVVVGVLLPRLGRRVNQRYEEYSTSEASNRLAKEAETGEKEFAEFIERFQSGELTSNGGKKKVKEEPPRANRSQFFAVAPDLLGAVRDVFKQLGNASDVEVRKRVLGELCEGIRRFRAVCDEREFKPAWQLATSLEELLKQIRERGEALTPSMLRTAAGALVCLEDMCKPGVEMERVMNPPPRFLVVDDEPVCRFAVSSALKRAFGEPDLASDGETGLLKAGDNAYDVIFVDVEMPGMDGFELCSQVHLTCTNQETPVVFVTSHSDFGSRTKSTEAGGYELIGKPFLPLEFIVKALTLVLRRRLFSPAARKNAQVAETTSPERVEAAARTSSSVRESNWVTALQEQAAGGNRLEASAAPSEGRGEAAGGSITSKLHELRVLSRQLRATILSGESQGHQAALREINLHLKAMLAGSEQRGVNLASKVMLLLESLVKKILEQPNHATFSALTTVAAALDLLDELGTGQGAAGAGNCGLQILVADDDPISRRTLSGALQLVFGRPEVVDSGEAAVKMASQMKFDVIFLDVLMPQLDGFGACQEIRAAGMNQATPIVFVTGDPSGDAQSRGYRSGGSGFIPKPALPAEIVLAATVFGFTGKTKGAGKAGERAQEKVR